MNKVTKTIYNLHNVLIATLLIVLIAGVIVWLVMDYQTDKEWQKVQQAISLVKKRITYQTTDVFGGCVHPDNGVVIVSVNHDSFFGVKDSRVFIPELTKIDIESSQAIGPDLPVEAHDINPYYVYEYCR